jgi:sulfate transport system substrate-binding protein
LGRLGEAGRGRDHAQSQSSGGARWSYLPAWGYALKKNNNDDKKAQEFVMRLYKNVPVLGSGARGSTTTFVQRGIGDVLLSWENEAFLALNELGKDKVEVITPSISILAEPPVSVVDKVAAKHGTSEIAKAYLEFLYTEEGQEIGAKNCYRPRFDKVAAKYADRFPKLQLFTIDELFGRWQKAQKRHFDDGGMFDKIYTPGRKSWAWPGSISSVRASCRASGPRSVPPFCT